jgi:hypothetical protein
MREIKSGVVNSEEQRDIVALQNIPPHQGLVKANRFLLLFASSLMVLVFILGFLLAPSGNILDNFNPSKKSAASVIYTVENSTLSAEINVLKGQFVGLISGSIESKLKVLEESLQKGALRSSLGTLEDIKSDVKILQAYAEQPAKKKEEEAKKRGNTALLEEVSQLKALIYFTLTSCGLMVAAMCGFWFKRRYRLSRPSMLRGIEWGNKAGK